MVSKKYIFECPSKNINHSTCSMTKCMGLGFEQQLLSCPRTWSLGIHSYKRSTQKQIDHQKQQKNSCASASAIANDYSTYVRNLSSNLPFSESWTTFFDGGPLSTKKVLTFVFIVVTCDRPICWVVAQKSAPKCGIFV